jgi:glycosyltransferase involved in cell wall biosynthesis
MILLSILIPSIPERKSKLENLQLILNGQIQKVETTNIQIEVLTDSSVRYLDGGLTVGEKRNGLVQNANGKYLCFLDDDDTPSPRYVSELVKLCQENKDVCCFRTLVKLDDYWGLVDHSINNPINEQMTPNGLTFRKAWHVNPVRSDFAKKHTFSNVNNAEDWNWMERVLTEVKTQAKTNEILLQYTHSSKTSAVDEIERQK